MFIFQLISCLSANWFYSVQVLVSTNTTHLVSQMPVVLIPIHFDRDPVTRGPSCQRSVVLRPFKTQDFMTGSAALPGKDLPVEVSTFI